MMHHTDFRLCLTKWLSTSKHACQSSVGCTRGDVDGLAGLDEAVDRGVAAGRILFNHAEVHLAVCDEGDLGACRSRGGSI